MNIDEFVKITNKKYGGNTIVRLGEKPSVKYGENIIPTGSIGLDYALGVGGIPRGRIIEILGNAGSGKTTLSLHIIAEAQKAGFETLYIDAEHALDVFYAATIGVDINKLLVHQPSYGEQALNIAQEAVSSGVIKLIVIDSVAALTPKRELDGEIGDAHIGLLARMMSQSCRMLSGVVSTQNCVIIFVNQFREAMSTSGFGGPTKKPTGGKALEYYASVILEVVKIQSLKDDGEASGNRTQITVKKNKVGVPYRSAIVDIVYGKGISRESELIDMAEEFGIIKKAGSWYKSESGTISAQGKNGMIKLLETNSDYATELTNSIRGRISREISGDGAVAVGLESGAEGES